MDEKWQCWKCNARVRIEATRCTNLGCGAALYCSPARTKLKLRAILTQPEREVLAREMAAMPKPTEQDRQLYSHWLATYDHAPKEEAG